MNNQTRILNLPGPVGVIEAALDLPDGVRHPIPRGLALVAHPHPLFGGTMDNKVAQTLARSFVQLGYVCIRPNFRGVGATAGQHDHGVGEQDDLLAVLQWMREPTNWAQAGVQATWLERVAVWPLALAGFSFGSYVVSQVARRLVDQGQAVERLVMVGTAAPKWQVATVPADTIVIHGELDETIPLAGVLDWARPQDLPVTVIPGADHFFHRRLHILKNLVVGGWHATP